MKHTRSSLAVLFYSCFIQVAPQQNLRRGLVGPPDTKGPPDTNPVFGDRAQTKDCTLVQKHTQYEGGTTPPGANDCEWECQLASDDSYGVGGITVGIEGLDLPCKDPKYNIKSGETTLKPKTGSMIIGKRNKLKFPRGVDPEFGQRGFLNPDRRHLAQVEGVKTVLVVKIVANDGSCTYSKSELSDKVFGSFGDAVNLASQYTACSHGKLNFTKAADRSSTQDNIADGVVTVTVAKSVSEGDGLIRSAVNTELAAMFGVSAFDLADHVMYCMPDAAMSGIAYAYIK